VAKNSARRARPCVQRGGRPDEPQRTQAAVRLALDRLGDHEAINALLERVVAPNRDPAGRAAGDLLVPAARRGRYDDFGLSGCVHDAISFIKSVERMRGPSLALAPTAMTGMNDQWCSDQTISDLPARASAFHVQLHRGVIASAMSIGITEGSAERYSSSAKDSAGRYLWSPVDLDRSFSM
jgi:hypothetical protein